MNLYIIIPAYNEELTIGKVIEDIQKTIPEVNIIVIDDGSKDLTSQKAKRLGVKVLHHFINRGQGAALQTGMDYALKQGADIIVHFDADGQHQAGDIARLIEPIIKKKVEVVMGSRFLLYQKSKIKNQKYKLEIKNNQELRTINHNLIYRIPFFKHLIGKLARLHTQIFIGLKVSDAHCGLRAFSRLAAEKIRINQDRMAHASEILAEIKRHNLSYKEVPVSVLYTDYSLRKGQKNFLGSLRIVYEFLIGRAR